MPLRFCHLFLVFMIGSAVPYLSAQSAANLVALNPCRIVDTRDSSRGSLGAPSMHGFTSRDFSIQQSSCGIPSTAVAYALNITVIPRKALGYLTIWPTGQAQPFVSTLNAYNGGVIANAAIVASGANGAISAFATDETDLIIDIDGYFTAASGSTDQINQNIAQTNQQVAQVNQLVVQQGNQITQQSAVVGQHTSQIGQLNQQITAHTASLTQQGDQVTQQSAVVGQHTSQIGQLNQQITAHTASLTQQANQITQLTQQVAPLTQQLSQVSQQATQVSQQAAQINQLLSQTGQQSTLVTVTNGSIHIGTPGVQTKAYVAGVAGTGVDIGDMVLIGSDGQLGTIQSSRRYKEKIEDVGSASDRLYQLRPVQFQYKTAGLDGKKPIQYGLIAEEVAQIYPELVVYNSKGELETVQYQKLPALLLNEIQKQHHQIEQQKSTLERALRQIQQLENKLSAFESSSNLQQ